LAQSARYGYGNLPGAGGIAVDADGLCADRYFASVAGDDEPRFDDAHGLAGGFARVAD
jgi:hypothetical protein